MCIHSDKKSNEEKELICFTLDVILGYRKEKILRIKEELKRELRETLEAINKTQDPEKKDKFLKKISDINNEIYSVKLSLFDFCPFTCNQSELRNNIY